MKVKLMKLFFLAFVLFTASTSVSAQIYVKIRPTFPVVVRPPQPSPVHIWVNEEWEPEGNSYRYSGGHWEAPSHRGYYRTQGHWMRNSHGQRWVPGTWRGHNNRVGYDRRRYNRDVHDRDRNERRGYDRGGNDRDGHNRGGHDKH